MTSNSSRTLGLLTTASKYANLFTRPAILLNFVLLFSTMPTTAQPVAKRSSVSEWFHDQIFPKKGTDLRGEIQCYGLPYGGLGFLSHLLTYYSTVMLAAGRSPSIFVELGCPVWDIFVNIVSIVATVLMAALTMSSCRNTWPFLLIALWKLILAIMQPLAAISGQSNSKEGAAFFIGFFYGIGTIIGATGTFQIVHETFASNIDVRIITFVLIAVVGIILIIFIIAASIKGNGAIVLIGTGFASVLLMLYSDWILAAVDRNWLGLPDDKHKALYWTYWAAKRLPMFSF